MLNTIKKILQKNKNAFIVLVENNQPTYVVLSFEEYERLSEGQSGKQLPLIESPARENVLDEVNQEIINLQAPQEEMEDIAIEEMAPVSDQQEIKIEDIPLL